MISRYIVIALAFGVAVFQASRGNWIESTGLLALGAGLVALRFAPKQRPYGLAAYVCFAITALAVAAVLVRKY